MHPTSQLKMEAFLKTYASKRSGGTVLDVGSRAVRADAYTYRTETDKHGLVYTGLDMEAGHNVDFVPSNPFVWDELASERFDFVISGQAFEHNPFMWVTFCEIARVLKQGGHAFIIAPSAGDVHRFPLDCWRYYPDSWSALCAVSGLSLTESLREKPSSFGIRGSKWVDSAALVTKPTFASESARQDFYNNLAEVVAPFKARRYVPVPAQINGGPTFLEYQSIARRHARSRQDDPVPERPGVRQRRQRKKRAAMPARQVQVVGKSKRAGRPLSIRNIAAMLFGAGQAEPNANQTPPTRVPAPRPMRQARQKGRARANRPHAKKQWGGWSVQRINKIAKGNGAKSYLEIGVAGGQTFNALEFPRKVAVDPSFRFNPATIKQPGTDFFEVESNEYFLNFAGTEKFDIIFIDGLHVFGQAYLDFVNSLKHAHDRTAWLIDDVIPSDKYSAMPDRNQADELRRAAGIPSLLWHGDVYKVIFAIHDLQPAYSYATINTGGNAQTLVWKAARTNVTPVFGSIEAIDKVDFAAFLTHQDLMNLRTEDEAIRLATTNR